MKTLDVIKKTREYLDYLEQHVLNNQKAWKMINQACSDEKFVCDDFMYHTITSLIDEHDLSKLSEQEFVQYRRHFYPVKEDEGDYIPDVQGNSYDIAWGDHLHVNLHHWEKWTTTKFGHPYASEIYCVCMLCDWLAMGMFFSGDDYIKNTRDYYTKNKDIMRLPEWADQLIENVLSQLEEIKDKENKDEG